MRSSRPLGPFFTPMRTDARVDTLLAGCIAAILWSFGFVPRRGLPGWVATVATLALGWFWLVADRAVLERQPRLYTGGGDHHGAW